MNTENIQLLQGLPLFGGISEQTIQFLLARSTPILLSTGEDFFRENEPASSLFVLEAGTVSVIKQWQDEDVVLHQLVSGDCFGEIALMEMVPRSATIRAETPCRAIEIPLTALFELYNSDLEQFTIIQMNLGREICRRLHQADAALFEARQRN